MKNHPNSQEWLLAWIGRSDHEAAELLAGDGRGPIASALLASRGISRLCLLTNYPPARSRAYCLWLSRRTGLARDKIDLREVSLSSPVDYDEIYAATSRELRAAGLPREDVRLTFHLSPGTPAMAVIWVVLARTRFPARLIQTEPDQAGVREVKFFTDVADAFLPEYLQRSGERINRLAADPQTAEPEFAAIIHRSTAVSKQIALAKRLAAYDVPVLIQGETGTGKELFAEAIHASSRRARGPYLAINCGAIPRELANSELFGHEKGAFTGAERRRAGYFEAADGGTLFLDEIGDLALDAQVRLLRVLQSREVTPVGSLRPLKINVRIVAATHRNLAADVAAGRFREDLYHRLTVGILDLPPLRERGADVELLIDHFLAQFNAEDIEHHGASGKTMAPGATALLVKHPWPGNVRELYHTITRSAIWSNGARVEADDVQRALLPVVPSTQSQLLPPFSGGFNLEAVLDNVRRHYIRQALDQGSRRKGAAAKLLGLASHQTLGNWMKKLDL